MNPNRLKTRSDCKDQIRMRHLIRSIPLFIIAPLFILLVLAPCVDADTHAWAETAAAEPARVLMLHSYHHGFSRSDSLQAGIEKAFEESPVPATLAVEYLDADRYPGDRLFGCLSELFKTKYTRRRLPDLIISFDGNALAFLLEYRDDLFPGTPVVFCGLNADNYDPSMIADRTGYTGVVERFDPGATIDLILRLQPKVKQIVFIHDRTASGLAKRRTIESLASRYEDRVEFAYPFSSPSLSYPNAGSDAGPDSGLGDGSDNGGGVSEQELFAFLQNLESRSAVFFLGFFQDRFGKVFSKEDILPRISEASPVPVYSYAQAYLGLGILGGKLRSDEEHGRSAAAKALRLIQGAPVEAVPVSVDSADRFMFDDRQLKRFSISESRLPEGSVIVFQPASLLEQHRTAALWSLLGIASLTGVTLLLLLNTIQRRRVERELAVSEEKFHKAFHSCPVTMSITTLGKGVFLDVNSKFLELTEYAREEIIGREASELGFWTEEQRADLIRNLKKKGYVHDLEVDLRTKLGKIVPLLWYGDVASIQNQACLIATGYDLTERKQAEKQIKASLREKEMLLREIHHRVKNNLMNISTLIQLESGKTTDSKFLNMLRDLRIRITAMTMVHESLYRSDDLTKVDFGAYSKRLVGSIRESYSHFPAKIRTKVDSVHLPVEKALLCGRIVVELVTNAYKHAFPANFSRSASPRESEDDSFAPAKNMVGDASPEIEVEMREQNNSYSLIVRDNGVGLPPDSGGKPSNSLGLELVKNWTRDQLRGEMTVSEGPGAVFTISFTVPDETG